MIKVDKNKYDEFLGLFDELSWHLSSLAVLEGNNPGELYISDNKDRSSAFLISPEGCYLAGNPDNKTFNVSLKKFFEGDFLRKWKTEEFELVFNPKWESTAFWIFQKRPLFKYNRFHYTIKISDFNWHRLDIGDKFKPISLKPDFVKNNLKISNMDHINKWILNNWGNYDNFKKRGFSFYILVNNPVLSWSVCDCIYQDRCEIGIHTDPKHRKQGLASNVVNAMLNHAFKSGIKEIGWHCAADNTGSYKTAEKAGFTKEREYYAYFGSRDEKKHYFTRTICFLFIDHNITKARECWQKASLKYDYESYFYYDIACGFALNKVNKDAFLNLKKAIKLGFNDKDHLLNDKDLNNIHTDPEWEKVITLLKN